METCCTVTVVEPNQIPGGLVVELAKMFSPSIGKCPLRHALHGQNVCDLVFLFVGGRP